jgi:hypothetical protein
MRFFASPTLAMAFLAGCSLDASQPLRAELPIILDDATGTIGLDTERVPDVGESCMPGYFVHRNAAGDGWDCVDVTSGLDVSAIEAMLDAASFCPRLALADGTVRRYVRDTTAPAGVVRCTDGDDEMVKVGDFWIDRYESVLVDEIYWNGGTCDGGGTPYGSGPSSSDDYPAGFPDTGNFTTPVYACSVTGEVPSRMMTWFQAEEACALAGKRLCGNDEWQTAVAGTTDPGSSSGGGGACITAAPLPRATGLGVACVSAWGAEDMIGNAAEYTSDWEGMDPATGNLATNATYGDDYMYYVSPASWQGGGLNFPAVVIRGGTWADGIASGAFAFFAGNAPSGGSNPTGARCCAGSR